MEFHVLSSLPGAEFVRVVRQAPPDIAVIDRAHAEVGVFFYLSASPPLRLPELVRAAAESIRQEASEKARQGELR